LLDYQNNDVVFKHERWAILQKVLTFSSNQFEHPI